MYMEAPICTKNKNSEAKRLYQYHGWAVVSEGTGDENYSEREQNIIASIKEYIGELQPKVDVLEMKAINGQYHLWMTGLWNREPSSKYNPVT